MKMRYIGLVAACILAVSACGNRETGIVPEEGVSLSLARERAESVSDVKYTLEFSIPEDRNSAITGHETVEFSTVKKQDIVLDFTSSSYSGVTVNGQEIEARYVNEHIVIPSASVQAGRNIVGLDFVSDDRFLNRNEEYLYTLFVPSHARSAFPCFDQPDLKAVFELSLNLPEGWTAVSNSELLDHGTGTWHFSPTQLIPTYLFSFVAGKWQTICSNVGDRVVTAYYRETDPKRIAQFPQIFKEVGQAIGFMEDYTGIKLPFSKYDFVIVPGFQFGGMEHPGAVLYKEDTMFLGENPTIDEREKRINLIAHETAHFWFGDMVTMKWFDDVWTKEVYANFFAGEMTEPMFPEINHDLAWLRSYFVYALADDRTSGSTPIRQQLGNLADAGLIYGNIIYDKAPVVMRDLVDFMGKDNFQAGIREYLNTFRFSNATWDDLISILDSHSEKDVKGFSDVWVYQNGMPTVRVTYDGENLEISQEDVRGRGINWPQHLMIGGAFDPAVVELGDGQPKKLSMKSNGNPLILNMDGRTYGLVTMDSSSELGRVFGNFHGIEDETAREATLINMYENYIQGKYTDSAEYLAILDGIVETEGNPQVLTTAISQIPALLRDVPEDIAETREMKLMDFAEKHREKSVGLQLLRMLMSAARTETVTEHFYNLWKNESVSGFSANDYISLSYQLAIRMPEKAHEILDAQRKRIDGSDPSRSFNADRLRQFDFVSRAAVPEQDALDTLFQDLLEPENRAVEPWAGSALALLNHFLRDESSAKYVRPGLDELLEVKATSDIFFPATWCSSLLGGHRCEEAYEALQSFLRDNPEYPQLLKNKILINTYNLERANRK